MSVYELAVIAVPLLVISLALDPRPARSRATPPLWAALSTVLAAVLGAVAVVLSITVLTGVAGADATVELVVELSLAVSMLLLCLLTGHQVLQPVTRTRTKGAGPHLFTGAIALATLCISVALMTSGP